MMRKQQIIDGLRSGVSKKNLGKNHKFIIENNEYEFSQNQLQSSILYYVLTSIACYSFGILLGYLDPNISHGYLVDNISAENTNTNTNSGILHTDISDEVEFIDEQSKIKNYSVVSMLEGKSKLIIKIDDTTNMMKVETLDPLLYPDPDPVNDIDIIVDDKKELSVPEYEINPAYLHYLDYYKYVINDENVLDDVQRNIEILNNLVSNENLCDYTEDELKERIYMMLEDKEEMVMYEDMVNDNFMEGTDVFIKVENGIHHDSAIRGMINDMMYSDYTIKEMIAPISKVLKDGGYSKTFNLNCVVQYIESFKDDINAFRALRHQFTDNDILLEKNISEEYKRYIDVVTEEFMSGKITQEELIFKYSMMMVKLGYSNNFIQFTVNSILKRIAMISNDDQY